MTATGDKHTRAVNCRVGTSGWQYAHWRKIFYPDGLPTACWFEHYAEHFDTVEINSTFYRMMPEETFRRWREKAPRGFLYAVKMWRQITHRKKLKDAEREVTDFLKRAAALGDRLGPILIQLPPNLQLDLDRLERFLAVLSGEFQYAMEFRHASWFSEEVCDLLRKHRVALCVFHHVSIACPRVVTAPLIYLRFHGAEGRYAGKYSSEQLGERADFVRPYLRKGHRLVAYFNNDHKGHAVENACEFRALLTKE
ncbi:DUF72 domain-containing protein [Candidatus Sumerlaeota bacterium]|nr:DUF72 domain-containing protein [Candidatus Sumerlaeota bacterium]